MRFSGPGVATAEMGDRFKSDDGSRSDRTL